MAWLTGYTYRKKITITGSTGAGTNYQTLLKVGESSGSTGANFNLEGHVLNFSNDIRFTDNDGNTLLDHWLEKTEGTVPNRTASFWVEVADDLGSNQDVYCYYGKSGDTSASNGVNTFNLFDDFLGTSLDTGKWTVNTLGTVTQYTIGNSILTLRVTGRSTTGEYTAVDTQNTYNRNVAVMAYVTGNSNGSGANQRVFLGFGTYDSGWYQPGNNCAAFKPGCIDSNPQPTYVSSNEGTLTTVNDANSVETNKNHQVGWVTNIAKFSRDGNDKSSITTNVPIVNISAVISAHAGAGNSDWASACYISIDWIAVRKYISTEPAFSLAGSEELRGAANFFYFF